MEKRCRPRTLDLLNSDRWHTAALQSHPRQMSTLPTALSRITNEAHEKTTPANLSNYAGIKLVAHETYITGS